MRKVVRHSVTGAYWSSGRWLDDWRFAQDFLEYEDAYKCAKEHKLRDVESHYIYGDEPSTVYDWAVPLG